ncbi:MAG TPA: hypothetical protein VIT23_12285 [Terrimicrobiaceae bacterium]
MKGLDRKFRFPQVLTICVALGGIQSTPAAPGDGTVHLFKCGKGGGYQVEFSTGRDISTYGFGNSDRAIVVNADNYDAEAGGLITNIKQPPKGSHFALLQVIVKVPEISQVVTIDVCFQTPHGKKVVELPFHKFHRQNLIMAGSQQPPQQAPLLYPMMASLVLSRVFECD